VQDKVVQAIRYKLQKRVRRLNSASHRQFPFLLRGFFHYLDSVPILAAVRDELLVRAAPVEPAKSVERILAGEGLYGETDVEAAAMGYLLLVKYAQDPDRNGVEHIGRFFGGGSKYDEMLDRLREAFLEPLYEYIDEHIDDQQAVLYFLRRYKHRCEWFHAERLRTLVEHDTQRGEGSLAFDLYESLHNQGIDFHIEPQSASGIADFVADQVGEDRVVADAKIFWPEKGKGKAYIISAFNQAYTYARDYNEPCAYLVIYKMSKEEPQFLMPSTSAMFPSATINNKTVFFVVVDICEHGVPASKRGQLRSVEISEADLIRSVESGQSSGDALLDTSAEQIPTSE
jgi:hypothetical protein